MDKVDTNGQMAATTMENSLKEISMVKERIILQSYRKLTMVNSKMGRWMAKVEKTTKMDESSLVNLRKVKNMAKVS